MSQSASSATSRRPSNLLIALCLALIGLALPASAQEGMWTLDMAPTPGGHIEVVRETPYIEHVNVLTIIPGLLEWGYNRINYQFANSFTCTPEYVAIYSMCEYNFPDNWVAIMVPYEYDGVGGIPAAIVIGMTAPSSRITLNAVPDPGYYFQGWGSDACPGDLSCQPTFGSDVHDLVPEFSTCPPGGSCITVQATPNHLGTVFLRQGTSATGPVMFSCDALCTFQVAPGSDWTLTTTALNGAVIGDWSGCDATGPGGLGNCSLHVTSHRRVGAKFKYPLVVTNTRNFIYPMVDQEQTYKGSCASSASPCTFLLDPGAKVNVTRIVRPPNLGSYRYTRAWQGCALRVIPGVVSDTSDVCELEMTGPKAVTSVYSDEWHFVVAQPQHGRIVSNPAGIDCSATSGLCDAWFPVYSTPTFTATPDPGYSFVGWNDGRVGFPGGDCAGAGPSPFCTVNMDHQPTLSGASFYPKVTVQVGTGGGVMIDVGSASPYDNGFDCPAVFPNQCKAVSPGSSVTLTRTVFSGFTFSGWGGACSGTSTCTPLINAATNITASFAGTHKLLLSTSAQGLVTLSSVPSFVTCGYGCNTSVPAFAGSNVQYSTGTVVTLTAISGGAPGYPDYVFIGWSGGCTGKSAVCTLNIGAEPVDPDGFSRVNANYTQGAQTQVLVIGPGHVTSDLPGVDCYGYSCTQYMAVGSYTTLTATPAPGYVFTGWSGSACSGTSTCTPAIHYDPPYGTGNTPITANFAPANVDLSSITLSRGALSPAFSSSTLSYTAEVGYSVPALSVTPTLGDPGSTVQVRSNGGAYSSVASGSASDALSLNVGANTVDMKVTASDLVTTKTYTVTVTRKAFGPGDVEAGFMPFSNTNILGMAAQPDGKTVFSNWVFAGTSFMQGLVRLNPDDSLDQGFFAQTNLGGENVNLQADGKLVAGGFFATVNGVTRKNIARVNQDGSVDLSYNPDPNGAVRCALFQPDGKLVIMGQFTTIGGVTQNGIARLLPDGSLDPAFTSSLTGLPLACAVQRDGKILIGNSNLTINGVARNQIARLNADGSLDASFNPGLGSTIFLVNSLIEQPDLKILVAGYFTSIGGVARRNLARLNPDGSVDPSFNPDPDSAILSVVLQTDGAIIFGGGFNSVSGVPRNRAARVNADGSLDLDFDPDVANGVRAVALQADGKVLISGDFAIINGITRPRFARLANGPATSSLTLTSPARIEWLRGGTSPEAVYVTFEVSTDGSAWSSLGFGTRVSGGWEWTGSSLPAAGVIRARARVTSGNQNASSGLVQATLAYGGIQAPEITVSGGGVNITSGDANPGLADQTDFGGVLLPGGTAAHAFTIRNTGFTDLNLGTIGVSGAASADYGVTTQPISPVPAGGSASFVVTFHPTAGGTRSAAISFTTNDADENPFTFSIQGAGVDAPVACPTITLPLSLPNGFTGAAYPGVLSAAGGVGPYTFSVTSGALPPSLTLVGPSISGTPSAPGTFSFGITATDTSGPGTCTGSASYTVKIGSGIAPGDLVIREFRSRGPAGAQDEYIEIANRTGSALTILAADGSAGYGLVGSSVSGCPSGTTTRLATIPNDTVIPAGGSFLAANNTAGTGYSLGSYGGGGAATPDVTWTNDLCDGSGIGLFNSASTFDSSTRLDAAGFGGSAALYREGAALSPAGGITVNGEWVFLRKAPNPAVAPKDTGDNDADFLFVSADAALYPGRQSALGTPGPQGLGAPRTVNLLVNLADPAISATAVPNLLQSGNYYYFRRALTNNTGAPITKLRYRIVDLTTLYGEGYNPGVQADWRGIATTDVSLTLSDASTPVARGLTLEAPTLAFTPSLKGGGYNASFTVDLAGVGGALADGASIYVNLGFRNVKGGRYSLILVPEILN